MNWFRFKTTFVLYKNVKETKNQNHIKANSEMDY